MTAAAPQTLLQCQASSPVPGTMRGFHQRRERMAQCLWNFTRAAISRVWNSFSSRQLQLLPSHGLAQVLKQCGCKRVTYAFLTCHRATGRLASALGRYTKFPFRTTFCMSRQKQLIMRKYFSVCHLRVLKMMDVISPSSCTNLYDGHYHA